MLKQLLKSIRSQLSGLPDSRKGGNNQQYTILDAVLSAFSVFFMQSPSFLAHQRDLRRQKGRDNAQSLFGVHEIPSDNQIRNLLDPLAPTQLGGVYWSVYEEIRQRGVLKEHCGIDQTLLCAMDGTQYFSSTKIHCPNCNEKQQGEQTTYSHSVIAPVLVSPNDSYVINLEPEFITLQDGSEKQDCEQNAIKRWIERNARRFAPYSITILSDDLHCHQPVIALCQCHKLNFIMVCLPDSHPTLYQEIALLDKINALQQVVLTVWNGRFHEVHTYRYVNSVPIRAGEDALKVNWCALTIVNKQTGELLYHNAFATNFQLSDTRVVAVVRSGRARWKTENENHNTLKNQGYHLEHNFGHGHQFLAAFLLSLNLLAFLLHTALQLTDTLYQKIRAELGPRTTFFDDIRTLTRYLLFDSWEHLLTFMATQLELTASP